MLLLAFSFFKIPPLDPNSSLTGLNLHSPKGHVRHRDDVYSRCRFLSRFLSACDATLSSLNVAL